jgi:hypothetical protein
MSEELNSAIAAQGIKIRDMKAAKAAKEALDVEVASLLALKKQFKEATGKDWAPAKASTTTPPPAPAAEKKKKGEDNKEGKKADGGGKGSAGEKEKDKKKDKKKAEASAAEPAAVFKAPKGMMFYPSMMDSSENMKVWLLASESKVNMATAESGAVPPPVPRLPAICDKNGTQVRFGANAICKYLEEVAGGESQNEDGLFELEEGALAAGAKDVAAAAALLKQLDLLSSKGGLSTAVQCVLYPSVKRMAAQAGGAGGAAATIIATVEAFAAFKSVSEKCQANLEELDGFDYRSAGLLTSLKLVFSHAIVTAFPQTVGLDIYEAVIVRCTNPAFGDFQCNNSMSISKALKVSCGKCIYISTLIPLLFLYAVFPSPVCFACLMCIDDRRWMSGRAGEQTTILPWEVITI